MKKRATAKKGKGPKAGHGQCLSSLEESVWRMRQGVSASEQEPLGYKTTDPKLLEQLLEIEKEVMAKALLEGKWPKK